MSLQASLKWTLFGRTYFTWFLVPDSDYRIDHRYSFLASVTCSLASCDTIVYPLLLLRRLLFGSHLVPTRPLA